MNDKYIELKDNYDNKFYLTKSGTLPFNEIEFFNNNKIVTCGDIQQNDKYVYVISNHSSMANAYCTKCRRFVKWLNIDAVPINKCNIKCC